MAITYINIFQSKALQNLPKVGIFGLKSNHLATTGPGEKELILQHLCHTNEQLGMPKT
jgi:hypothetical protein